MCVPNLSVPGSEEMLIGIGGPEGSSSFIPPSPTPFPLQEHIWFVNLSHSSFRSLPAAVSSVEFRPKMGVGDSRGDKVRAKGGGIMAGTQNGGEFGVTNQ